MSLLYFPPTILLFFGSVTLITLIVSLFSPRKSESPQKKGHWIRWSAVFSLLISLIWVLLIYPSQQYVLLSGHFVWNPLTALLCAAILSLSIPVFIYIEQGLSNTAIVSDYYILCLLSLFGALVMLTAGSTISFYLGLEILSLPLYGLVGLGSENKLKIEAAMKYIIMGVVASILLLYGLCLLYFVRGHFNFTTDIAWIEQPSLLTQISTVLLLAAFLFKLGAIPFHFWVPDVYSSTALATGLFVATIPKFAAIGMGIRLFFSPLTTCFSHLQPLILGLGLLSIVGGNLVALMQNQVKRLFAYSSIAHMGFIILGLALPIQDYSVVLFYGISYCLMATMLFGILTYLTEVGLEVSTMGDLQGLHKKYPIAALLMLLVVSSMAGFPPFLGFFSKFGLLYNLLKQKHYIVSLSALMATVTGAYYYLYMIKLMYFDTPTTIHPIPKASEWRFNLISLIGSGLILISLSVYPSILMDKLHNSTVNTVHLSFQQSDAVKTDVISRP